MARIIGGIGTSHVPIIAVAYDRKRQEDPAWKPLFDGYKPVADWLAHKKPDVLLFFYNDHATTLFFDFYPTFALGIGAEFPVADEGAGSRNLPSLKGDVAFQAHIGQHLVNEEFDLTFFQNKPIDHGIASPLPLLWPHETDWPGTIVPIAINVLQYPLPTARRCYRLGQAVRRAIESYPKDLSVVIVGTGGLSHQIHGERAGYNNTQWDMEFLDLLRADPEKLVDMRHADYVRLGGAESVEQIMWLAMRGALAPAIHEVSRNYYLATTTAMTVVAYDEEPPLPVPAPIETGNPQLAGVEELPGTYPFDLIASNRALRLNRFFWELIAPEARARFHNDLEAAMVGAGLDDHEKQLVRACDWLEFVRYGVSFFVLEKLARTVKTSNLEMYAQMRGESFEAFLATRRVPEAR